MSNEHVRPCQAEAKTLNKAVDLNERVPLFIFDQFLIEILGLQICNFTPRLKVSSVLAILSRGNFVVFTHF